MIELRLKEIDEQTKQAHQELLLTSQPMNRHQQTAFSTLPSEATTGYHTMPGSLPVGVNANYLPQATVPEDMPLSHTPFSQSMPTNYQPLYPEPLSELSKFSQSLPADAQYTSDKSRNGSADHVQEYSNSVHAEESYSDSAARPGPPSHTTAMDGVPAPVDHIEPPFARAQEQMRQIHDYQEHLMKRHRDRQQALLEARQNLEKRGRDLLDDSLHQVGLNPIYDGKVTLPDAHPSHPIELGHFQDVDFSVSTEKTRSATDGMTHGASYVADPIRQAGEHSQELPVTLPAITEDDLKKQLEDIEKQKQEILDRDQYHREQIDRLKSQWQEQFEQTKQLGDGFRKSQAQASIGNRFLNVMEDDLEGIEQNMDTRNQAVLNQPPISLAAPSQSDRPHHSLMPEHNNTRPDLSTIMESPKYKGPNDGSRQVDLSNYAAYPYGYSTSLGERVPSVSDSHDTIEGGIASPDLEAENIEAFGNRLAQIQQDFGQLTAQVNSYLDDPVVSEEADVTKQSGEQSENFTNISTPTNYTKTSSTQQVIDEIISPLRFGRQDGGISLASNRSHGSQQPYGNTWHERLLPYDATSQTKVEREGFVSQYGSRGQLESGNEFFELRPEFASPNVDDRGFDTNHRLSSTPVSKRATPKQDSPPFKPLQPDNTQLSGDLTQYHMSNDSRFSSSSSGRRDHHTGLSEPSQYSLANVSEPKLGQSASSGDSKILSSMENRSAQSPSQYPLQLDSSGKHSLRPSSPTARYSADPYLSSASSSSTREHAEDLTRRIEATLSVHEQLLKESREIRERHALQRKSPMRISSEGQLLKEVRITNVFIKVIMYVRKLTLVMHNTDMSNLIYNDHISIWQAHLVYQKSQT